MCYIVLAIKSMLHSFCVSLFVFLFLHFTLHTTVHTCHTFCLKVHILHFLCYSRHVTISLLHWTCYTFCVTVYMLYFLCYSLYTCSTFQYPGAQYDCCVTLANTCIPNHSTDPQQIYLSNKHLSSKQIWHKLLLWIWSKAAYMQYRNSEIPNQTA